jgi:hypothetical protein
MDFFIGILTSPAFPIFTGLIGFLLGHYLAIGRDRRKELNELIKPVRIMLWFIRDYPFSNAMQPSNIDYRLIREKLPFWKRRGFDRAVKSFEQSKSAYKDKRKPDGMGGFINEASAEDGKYISHAAICLLKYLKPM